MEGRQWSTVYICGSSSHCPRGMPHRGVSGGLQPIREAVLPGQLHRAEAVAGSALGVGAFEVLADGGLPDPELATDGVRGQAGREQAEHVGLSWVRPSAGS